MTIQEIITRLQLSPNTISRNLAARAIRQHAAGGSELLDAKEWASGIAVRSHDPVARKIGANCLGRLEAIERAMLAALEAHHGLPAGCLVSRV